MAVYGIRSLRCEEYGGTAQLIGLEPATCGGLGADERIERVARTVSLLLTQRSGLRRSDVTRADTVALDVVLAILRADVAREHLQTTLGGSVSRYGLTTQLRHHRADVDNLTLAALHHLGKHGARADKRTNEVDVDHLLELRTLHLVHRDALDDTCVVYQDVDLTHLGVNLLNQLLYLLLVRHVTYIAVYVLDAVLLVVGKTLLECSLVDVVEDDVLNAGSYESSGNVETDT